MGREEGEAMAMAEGEESSQCSSGCQSGWTLYLDHSGSGSAQQQCRSLPYHSAGLRRQTPPQPPAECNSEEDEEDEDDSMVSDASSGPPHRPCDDEEELLQAQGHQIAMPSQQRRGSLAGDHNCYDSGIGEGRRSESVSGSRSLLPTRSRSLGDARSRKKRKAAVLHRKVEAATSRYGVVDDGDLHDTASSSAVVVEAMHLRQPSCDFLVQHCSSLGWPAV